MTTVRVVADAGGLPRYTRGAEGTIFWGMLGLVAIEATVFGSLVSSYFYLRARSPDWPPGGVGPPDLLLPTIGTMVILASSVVLHWADKGIEKEDTRRVWIGLLGSSVLGFAFLVLKVVEYSGVSYRWDSHAYGSIVWTIIGFHGSHVTALLLKTLVVATLAIRGYFNRERRLGVTINGIYWHFVVAIWIPLYVVLYLVPRM